MAFDAYDPDLPDELQGRTPSDTGAAEPQQDPEERQNRLDALSEIFRRYRAEAVKSRKDSGIEDVWAYCEDAYLCIDDANRPADRPKWNKPTSIVGPLTKATSQNNDNKSTAFVRLTARYVDMGAAKISEIVLPIDDKAFSFAPTPVPDLVDRLKDPTPVNGPNGPMMRPAPPTQPGQAPAQVPLTVGDLAKATMDKATQAAEKAESRIYDWMVESRYPMQMRKVIFDAARIGTGVLKGPYPDLRKSQSFSIVNGVGKLTMEQKVAPAYKSISAWNLFPHGACGDDIHTGDYLFERDNISESTLRGLKEQKDQDGRCLYIGSQIDKVIEEGPNKSKIEGRNPAEKDNDSQYEIWYGYATLKRDDFLALEPALATEDLPDDLLHVFCILTMVNDTVIGATMNPLESGKFPYRVLPWSRRAGHWAGVGVSEQVTLAQRTVNAGTRRLFDNAGISSGAQIVVNQGAVYPADNNWQITPDKLWITVDGASVEDVRKVFMSVEFPNLGPQLMAIIDYGFKLAEEASNIPLISQGQTGPQDPQTFGQAELQNSNANSLLRNLGYNVDDCITEPVVTDSYEWLLMDPDVPEEEKGDFKINARGSIAMVEKAIQEQTLATMLALSRDPSYGWNPKNVAEEFARAKRMDPRRLGYSEEEQQQMAQQQPPEAPAVTVAKLKIAADAAEKEKDRQLQILIQHSEEYIQQMKQSGASAETVEQLKAMLAATVMKLKTQEKLSVMGMAQSNDHAVADHAVDLYKHRNPQALTPPTEPAGRAPKGEAFQA